MADSPRLLITGASGYVGQQLMAAAAWEQAEWLGRKEVVTANYTRIRRYDEEHLAEYVRSADVVVHLAAAVRGRDQDAMIAANVELTSRLIGLMEKYNSDARLIFFSTDLATSEYSLYGRSKNRAEQLIGASALDAVCLRASMIVGEKRGPLAATFDALTKLSRLKVLPVPNGGRFLVRPLWIGDIVQVLHALIGRRGQDADRGIWSMYGASIRFVDLMRLLARAQGNKPLLVPFPVQCITWPGRALLRLRPRTQVPIDFLVALTEAVKKEELDVFQHLGIERTPIDRIVQRRSCGLK